MQRLLNVGGNSRQIPLPPQYAGFEHLLLDIDPRGAPDIVCDARQMMTLAPGQSYVSPELAGAVIPAGSALRAYASAGTSITFTMSGLLIQ